MQIVKSVLTVVGSNELDDEVKAEMAAPEVSVAALLKRNKDENSEGNDGESDRASGE